MDRMQAPGSQGFYRGADRIIGGVCSGLAEGFHVEVLWVRVAFVVLGFINGVGLLLYIVLWVLMPERAGYRPPGQNAFESMGTDIRRAWIDLKNQFGSGPATPAASASNTGFAPQATSAPAPAATEGAALPPVSPQSVTRNPTFIFGAILVVIGIAFLAANSGVTWDVILPAALIALGIVLLVRNLQKRA
ncbi:MAG TPA: PspC domain-containing protein [Candidatus Dormibacteraeota bacterium]|jgi:phage shock protein PspC (stress-responsive transcriptional regulator)|nr:PspC domain-containing protein [Candidatus Dormibacteraeota bacterium]